MEEWQHDEMDELYDKILESPTIKTSDPATRSPLTGVMKGSGIRPQTDKSRTCDKCKFGSPDNNIHTRGQCVAIKNQVGAIWTRRINDYYGMTCDLFSEGVSDFRDRV